MLVEHDAALVIERYALCSKAFFHDVRAFEVALPGESSVSIDDPVTWEPGRPCGLQRPTHRSCPTPKMLRDASIRRHLPIRYPGHDVPYAFEEVAGWSHVVS